MLACRVVPHGQHDGAISSCPLFRAVKPTAVNSTGIPHRDWLLAMQQAVASGSGTHKAIEHALKRWPALVRYADSGTFPIVNNAVENAIGRSPLARRTCSLPARSAPADALPPSRPCWVLPSLMASIRCIGWPAYWDVSRRAQTARSIRYCHSRTLRSLNAAD